jgi:hypothetical protein
MVTAGLVLLPSAPAFAQPPANDDFDTATAFTAVPFGATADTTEATRAADDPGCIAEDGNTVWYELTVVTTTEVVVDTFGSDYDTTLSAWTGERGGLELVDCNDDAGSLQSLIRFTAEAGVTYHLMVAPPPMELAITLAPTGSVSNGAAVIGGTVSCSRPGALPLVGTLRQRAGGRVTVGSFAASVDCTGSHSWQATVLGETGIYRRGPADAVAAVEFIDHVFDEVVRARATATVQLR